MERKREKVLKGKEGDRGRKKRRDEREREKVLKGKRGDGGRKKRRVEAK